MHGVCIFFWYNRGNKHMKLGYFVSKKIDKLVKKAENAMDRDEWLSAIKYYNKILDLLPEPKEEWAAYEWTVVSIADSYYIVGDYDDAEIYFEKIIKNTFNPFIYLRYGQVKYYKNDMDEAKNYLVKAYTEAGKQIFDQEDSIFLEIALENKDNIDYQFINMYKLPIEYQYLEKENMRMQYLWEDMDWHEIYKQYSEFFKKIPEELYTNTLAYMTAAATLESAIFLNKFEVFPYWINKVESTLANRYDDGEVEAWKGICEFYQGHLDKAMEYFEIAVLKGDERVLCNFRHFGNKMLDFYKENKTKLNSKID